MDAEIPLQWHTAQVQHQEDTSIEFTFSLHLQLLFGLHAVARVVKLARLLVCLTLCLSRKTYILCQK